MALATTEMAYRILGHMVTRNEVDRHLPAALSWLETLVDDTHVHDDCSTDGTWSFLRHETSVALSQRAPEDPAFINDESAFRAGAWQEMEQALRPVDGDWILCIDADEFLVADNPRDRAPFVLDDQVASANHDGNDSVTFPVAEVFDFENTEAESGPLIRIDGYWRSIEACRLVRWRPEAHFTSRREGGGSVPAGWTAAAVVSPSLHILHFGYARHADRVVKHHRYRAGRGHNPHHVASILQRPDLTRWTGEIPPLGVPT